MRPFPGGDDSFGRARAATDNDRAACLNPSAAAAAASQMTYFIGDEAAVGSALQQQKSQHSPAPFARPKEPRKSSSTHGFFEPPTPGLPGGESTTSSPGPKDAKDGRPLSSKGPLEALRHEATASNAISSAALHDPASFRATSAKLSQPMTPILLDASGPASALSSISSRRNSLSGSEDTENQAVSVHEDEGGQAATRHSIRTAVDDTNREPLASMTDSGSAPQLIMPSIKMPSRRPFTDEGKGMGRLKLLVAGDSGVGKTSLIKAIVQSCEHIVHVDPIAPPSLSSSTLITRSIAATSKSPRGIRRQSAVRVEALGTRQITEIYASTKPYPEWWSEMDDIRVLKRRKSLGDAVLDRNICFVDTPGYGSTSSSMNTITPVVQYIEAHLQRLNANSLSDADLLTLLGGHGGLQIDVAFYMVLNRLRPVDMQYLQQLSSLTNIVILLAQADLMSAEQVAASKEQICTQLREARIQPFSFGLMSNSLAATKGGLFAVSSAPGLDHETMDASLLMSPDYVQPLMPTELSTLVARVFSQNGISWLRHSAARKYIQWRKRENAVRGASQPRPGPTNSYAASPNSSQMLASETMLPSSAPPLGAATSYALARVTDHTQREERLAQIRLANWAADLQRSLANERAQYEAVARSERAFWLTEKLNECVQDGMLVPVSQGARTGRDGGRTRRQATVSHGRAPGKKTLPRQDPLGLLEVAANLRRKGLFALELLGSLGVLGGIALWVSKHYWHFEAYEWMLGEWDRFWYGAR